MSNVLPKLQQMLSNAILGARKLREVEVNLLDSIKKGQVFDPSLNI